MMHSQKRAAQYGAVRSAGLVADASPTRLVQIMYEQILSNLETARVCMERIEGNLPWIEVKNKGIAMRRALRLLSQLDASLNMELGGEVAENLRNLYRYMLNRLTQANVLNDPQIVAESLSLIAKIKGGWDQIVKDDR
jgi:flagellar protein FliS